MISANTLFHFTSSIDILKAILGSNEFLPSFCIDNYTELLQEYKTVENHAIPMVCFCDIPLSQIKEHTNEYGQYAIGLDKKKWALVNNINPVLYLTKNEIIAKPFANLVESHLNKITEQSSETDKNIVQLLQFVKPLQGRRWIKNDMDFDTSEIDFYQEREWRYVPDKTEGCTVPFSTFIDANKKTELFNKLKECCTLKFCADDINYIIVKTESQVHKMIEFIEGTLKFKKAGCSDETRKLLCSKILTMKQINEDF